MNPTFLIVFDAELAGLTPIEMPAVEPLGYGIDLDCSTDCTDDFAEVDPQSPRAIVQALIRRYTTRRGTIDDKEYGLDVRAFCNRGVTLDELRSLSTMMSAEARKDDRVESARVTVESSLVTHRLDCVVVIEPADPRLAEFTLTFAVTSAGVLVDTIGITGI